MIKPLAKLLANVYKNVIRCNDCGNLKITTQKFQARIDNTTICLVKKLAISSRTDTSKLTILLYLSRFLENHSFSCKSCTILSHDIPKQRH